jgi:hypothetical protein
VSSPRKVVNLNADKVDGMNATGLRTKVLRYTVHASGPFRGVSLAFPDLPRGTWLASYTIVTRRAIDENGPACRFTDFYGGGQSWSTKAIHGFSANNATTVVASPGVTLNCGSQQGDFSIYSSGVDARSSVSFTRIDSLAERDATIECTNCRTSRRLTP